MKRSVCEHDVWLAIRDLYRWRKLSKHIPQGTSVFDRIERGAEEVPEAHLKAYEMWKQHPKEEVFFQLNYFSPITFPQD